MTQRLLAAAWRRPVWLLWVPPAFWAGNVVLGRAFSTSFPPVSLAVGRWLVALVALAPFVWRDVLRERRLLLRHWKLIWACGALGIAGYNALAYVALRTVPAASVAFLNSTLPLMVPLAAAMLGVERITSRAIVGIVVSFGGVAWIVARGHWEDLVALRFDHGELIVILATANYAIYSVLLRRKPRRSARSRSSPRRWPPGSRCSRRSGRWSSRAARAFRSIRKRSARCSISACSRR